MYTVHFYAGTHKQWLRDRTDEAIRNGIPVFISESAGMEASGDGKIDDVEWKKFIDWIVKNKLSWISWSVSDKEESCSVLLKSASSTESGKSATSVSRASKPGSTCVSWRGAKNNEIMGNLFPAETLISRKSYLVFSIQNSVYGLQYKTCGPSQRIPGRDTWYRYRRKRRCSAEWPLW